MDKKPFKRKVKDNMVAFVLDNDTHDFILDMTHVMECSKSEVIRQLISFGKAAYLNQKINGVQ